VAANRPDVIKKKEKICTLIDVAIPADRNIVQKEAEKELKHNSLCIDMHRYTTNVVDEMYDHTGNIWNQWNSNKILMKSLDGMPGKHSIN